jgi:thiol:disulfide interchange protein
MQQRLSRRLLTLVLAIAAWLWVLPTPMACANPVQTEHVEVQLVSELQQVQPGSPFWVALRFQIQKDWHIYWKNPGDSGASPTIDWQLPEGVTAGGIQWPAPERLPVGPLMNFGYSGEVLLPTQLSPAATVPSSEPLSLQAGADWLVCKVDCIPESATLNLTLSVQETSRPDPQWQPALETARQTLPQPSPWPVAVAIADNTVTVQIDAPGLNQGNLQSAAFFPEQDGVIVNAAPQTVAVDDAGLTLTTEQGYLTDLESVSGVLVLEESLDAETVTRAVEFTAPVSATLPTVSQSASGSALWQVMGLAFLGGLVLNLMPCVFPVLSLKALSIVQKAEKSSRQVRLQAIAFTAGVLVSFTVIVSVLLALRALGQQIGWGFQLQSPWFVALMAYLMFAVGLSLSGVFVFGANLMGIGQGLTAQSGYRGEFFSGMFATVVATPCTAPFMATAIGVALTQSPLVAIAIFELLAIGLALPYIILSLSPALRNRLPKPGAWMETFQQVLAFPMYGATAWLVWVLTLQAGPTGLAAVLSGLILIAFAAWLHQKTQVSPRLWKRLGSVVALVVVSGALTLTQIPTASPPAGTQVVADGNATSVLAWKPYTAQRLEELKAAGEPIFVNFSASWCITCLVNEQVALSQPVVANAFEQKGVAYLKADWTNRDDAIAQTLESFGRSGVPLYLAYSAGASEPTVLPQLLTPEIVVEAIEQL